MITKQTASGLCVLQYADEGSRPVIELLDPFFNNYVKNIQGRDYAQVTGLNKVGREAGYGPVFTELVQPPNDSNGQTAIFRAKVWDPFAKEWWAACGDANAKNVANAKIAPHFIRIAETRAIGRAWRFVLGIDMVCFEEMQADDDTPNTTNRPSQKAGLPTPNIVPAAAKNEAVSELRNEARNESGDQEQKIAFETLEGMKKLVEKEGRATWIEVRDFAKDHFSKTSRTDLTEAQGQEVLKWLRGEDAAVEQPVA